MAKDLSEFPQDFNPEQYRKEATKLGEQVAEYMNKGYMNALRKSDIYTTRAFQQRYSAIGYQLEFGIIDQAEYFEKLAAIRDRYFAKDTQEWYKYTMEIYDYKVGMLKEYEAAVEADLQELAKLADEAAAYLTDCVEDFSKNALSRFSQIAANAEKTVGAISDAKDKYADKLFDSVGTGVGYDTDVTKIHNYYPTGDTLVITDYSLSKLDEEIEALKAFDETVKALQERASSLNIDSFRVFFEELRTMSVDDAARLSNLLLSGSDEDFAGYLEAYRQKKEISESIAASFYAADYQTAAESIRKEIESTFSEIPADFFTYGELTAENFKAGFLAEIESLFAETAWLFGLEGIDLHANLTTNPENNTFAPTYNLVNYGETTAEQLIAARNHAILEKLRQGAQ